MEFTEAKIFSDFNGLHRVLQELTFMMMKSEEWAKEPEEEPSRSSSTSDQPSSTGLSSAAIPGEPFRLSTGLLYLGCCLILFLIVHLTMDRLVPLLQAVSQLPSLFGLPVADGQRFLFYVPSLKGMLFLCSTAVLALPIMKDVRRMLADSDLRRILASLAAAVCALILLNGLIFTLENKYMGVEYAARTLNPFAQNADWFNKRLFMPALAHILFFRDQWLFYLFSNLIFLLFLALLYAWVKENGQFRFWQFFSLSTCSFAIFQCQSPGYPDILVFTFFLLVMYHGFSQNAKLAMLLLALVTHEASLFVGVVLAWRYLDWDRRVVYVISLVMYGVIWLGAYGFALPALVASHNVRGRTTLQWIALRPGTELLGIFLSFKAVWVLAIVGAVLAVRRRWNADAGFILASLAGGLGITLLAVDTSRVAAYGFPGVLAAIAVIRHGLPEKISRWLFSIVLLVNLVIPSFYVGLNCWIDTRPGLYKALWW